jgi:hypothetical protein
MINGKESMKAYKRAWYLEHQEEVLKKHQEYRKKHKDNPKYQEMIVKSRLKHRYNITLEEYNNLVIKQNGVCAICKEPETSIDPRNKRKRILSVDHNHQTGQVRGLLCILCNQAIGMLKEKSDNFLNASKYLKGELK